MIRPYTTKPVDFYLNLGTRADWAERGHRCSPPFCLRSASAAARSLHRILGVTFGIAIAVGGTIGSGILRTPSLIAAVMPSGGLILGLWVVGALHVILGTVPKEFGSRL